MDVTDMQLEATSWLVGALVLLHYAVACWRVRRRILAMEKDTSRFPLFGVRGALVRLVAEGKMSERDEAWQAAYEAVNNLLRLDARLDAHDLLIRILRQELAFDSESTRSAKLLERRLKRAMTDVPEFGVLLEQLNSGLLEMVHRRTTYIGWLTLKWRVLAYVTLRCLYRSGVAAFGHSFRVVTEYFSKYTSVHGLFILARKTQFLDEPEPRQPAI